MQRVRDCLETIREQRRRRNRPACLASCAAAIVLYVISIATITICYFTTMHSTPDPTRYAIIFDAGSSGNRMYIYKWDGTKAHGWNSTPIIDQIGDACKGKSLSSYSNYPLNAGPELGVCLEKAMKKLPHHVHQKTAVFVGATAGMRLISENSSVTDAIFNSVRSTLKSYPFLFRDENARIISDMEEGTFAWVSVNYLNVKLDYIKKLREKTDDTLGTLDLGGASAQISFVPDPNESNMPSNYTMMVKMFGTNYTVYSHSFFCFGKDKAFLRMLVSLLKGNATRNGTVVTVPQPCAPHNATIYGGAGWLFDTCTKSEMNDSLKLDNITFIGTGDPAKCASLVPSLFNKTSCTSAQCSFNGVYQPHLKGIFLALSGYFYTYEFYELMKFYNFTDTTLSTTLEKFQESVYTYCSRTWDEVLAMSVPEGSKPFLRQYCFDGHYVIALIQSLGFDSKTWSDIITTETMSGTTVGWTLGLLVTEINTMAAITVRIVSKVPLVSLIVFFTSAFITSLILLKIYRMRRHTQDDEDGEEQQEKMANTQATGVYLGTTSSCAVFQHDILEIIANDQGNRTKPNYVSFTESERLISDAAKNQVAMNPNNTISMSNVSSVDGSNTTVQTDMKH